MTHRVLLISGGKFHDYARAVEIFSGALIASNIEVHATTDASAVARLPGQFTTVVLYTQGDVLDANAVESLGKFVRNGGGLLALHAANTAKSDALVKLIGTRFKHHGPAYDFIVNVADADHPIAHRIQPFKIHDELYTLDATSDFHPFLSACADNRQFPLGYSKSEGKGKVVYFANGHSADAISNPTILQLITRAVRYAGGEDWSSKTVKVAAIGYGGAFSMGKTHLESCVKARMQAVAVCDMDPKRTATAQSDFGPAMKTYSRVDDMLSDSDAEMCIVITPHNTHAPLSIQCLEAGRHVVTEKPYTINVEEATRVIETARSKMKMATVFHNRRWDGDFMTIRDIIRSGAIGDVFKIDCYMGGYSQPKPDWWRACKEISGGALHDWGAHFVDWILQLMPHKIESVAGFFQKKLWYQSTNEDHAEATVRFEGGRQAHVEFSSIAAIGKQRFRILGTHGAIQQKGWDAKDGIRVISHKSAQSFDGTVPCQPSDWNAFYRNIADHLILNEPLIVTPESARKVIAVISLAEESSKLGGAPLPLPFDQ